MLNIQKRKSEGFTIIEVMIVLAIAAMILLVVLLAVPNLQRNSRNTALKNDVGSIQGAISDYAANNNGVQPDTFSNTSGTFSAQKGSTDANAQKVKIQSGTAVSVPSSFPSGTGVGATTKTPIGEIWIQKGKNCEGTSSTRSYALWYVVEISGNTNQQCSDASA